MKTATVTINLAKEGHEVTREGVTPAELALLIAEHHANSGGKPIALDEKGEISPSALKATAEVTRSPSEEKARLRGRYAANKIEAMYPGASPNLPTDYKEAYKMGLGTSLPTSKLTEVKIA